MPAEAIGISAFFILRRNISVVVRVAIEHQVMAAFGQVKTNGLPVVHSQLLVGIVAALVTKTFGLGMFQNGHLDAHHLKAFEVQVGAVHLKSRYAVICRLDGTKIEHREFPWVSPIADGGTWQTTFIHQVYIRPNVFVLGHLRYSHLINAATQIHGITWLRCGLCPLYTGKRGVHTASLCIVSSR